MPLIKLLRHACRLAGKDFLLKSNRPCIMMTITMVLSVALIDSTLTREIPGANDALPPAIDSVEIVTENVFDLSDPKYNNFIFKLANRTHFVTRHSVIRRELLLGKGDVYDTALVNESIRNLRWLPYLLKTDIYLKPGEAGENIMVVNTSDKWTTVGGLSFHRSAGRSDLQIGIEENNLLGYGMFMSHDYFILDDDRNYYQIEVGDHRFLGKELSLSTFYSDNPRRGQSVLFAARPFYALQQKWAAEIVYMQEKKRLDYPPGKDVAVRDRLDANRLQLLVDYRIGPSYLKYHFIPFYRYTDLSARDREVFLPDSVLAPLPEDSLTHYFQFTFGLEQIKYASFTRLNRFHKAEDVNLGFDGSISAGIAYDPSIKKSPFYHYAFLPRFTSRFASFLTVLGFHMEEWRKAETTIRQKISCYFKGFWQYEVHNTFVINVNIVSDKLEQESNLVYLDEDNGLRGYPAGAFGGEKRFTMNLENRFYSDLELLSAGIGGVAFADIGSIWSRNRDFVLRDINASCGVGLRFGISRSTSAEIIRLDFAYAPERKTWQISVGTGQFF